MSTVDSEKVKQQMLNIMVNDKYFFRPRIQYGMTVLTEVSQRIQKLNNEIGQRSAYFKTSSKESRLYLTNTSEFKFIEEKIFKPIYRTPVSEYMGGPRSYNDECDFFISNTLGAYYAMDNEIGDTCAPKAIEYMEYMLTLKPPVGINNLVHSQTDLDNIIQGTWTNLCSMYFQSRKYDQAKRCINQAVKKANQTNTPLDVTVQAYCMVQQYFDTIDNMQPFTCLDQYKKNAKEVAESPIDHSLLIKKGLFTFKHISKSVHFKENKKILIMSCDINKNAVVMFIEPFLRQFKEFDVYILYMNPAVDPYYYVYKKFARVHDWKHIHNFDDQIMYLKHLKPDVLIDLIAMGSGGNPMMAMVAKHLNILTLHGIGYPSNVNKQLNYKIYDYFISDQLITSDNRNDVMYLDIMSVYLNFIDETVPSIEYSGSKIVGYPHRSIKTGVTRQRVLDQLSKLFTVELKQEFQDIGKIPNKNATKFTDDHVDFLKLFNRYSCVIDCYPYSGTTMCCSSLLMGCPYIVYLPNFATREVERVSMSIVKRICPEYIVYTYDDLIQLIKHIHEHPPDREQIRERFLKLMDSEKYAQDFQSRLSELLQRTK